MDALKKKKEKTKLDDDDDDSKPFPKKMKRDFDGSVTPGATVLRPTDDDEEDLGGWEDEDDDEEDLGEWEYSVGWRKRRTMTRKI